MFWGKFVKSNDLIFLGGIFDKSNDLKFFLGKMAVFPPVFY